MASRRILDEGIREKFLVDATDHLTAEGEEVLRVKSNEIALPVVDAEGNDKWLVVTFKVPTAEDYDGYSDAEDYQMKLAEKKAKAEEKARKAKADEEKRKAKAEEAEKIKAAKEAKKIREAEKAEAEA